MNCREVRELLDSFLGGELLTETNHAILRHVEQCNPCRIDLERRRRLRAAVQTAFERSPDLRPDPLMFQRLSDALRNTAVAPAQRRSWTFGRWFAVAATIVLASAAGLWGYRWQAADAWLRAAVGDHRNCALHFRLAERPVSLEEAARLHGPAFEVFAQYPAQIVTTADGEARVLERHACVYDGRRYAHVVLRYRGAVVSLLSASDAGVTALPASASAPRTARRDGMTVIGFRTGGRAIFLVSDLDAAQLKPLADAVTPALVSRLAAI